MKADARPSLWNSNPMTSDGNTLAADGHPPARDGYYLLMGARSLIPFA